MLRASYALLVSLALFTLIGDNFYVQFSGVTPVESTCWQGKTPLGNENEIIEIGVCVFDTQALALSDKRSILVKPVRSYVSEFCTELTSLTQEEVDKGIIFAEACSILGNNYMSKSIVWGSWSNYDRQMFEKQCKSFNVPYPFGDQHLNIKSLFSDLLNNGRRVGMSRALKILNLQLEGTHHRGHDDAWNIGRILKHLVQNYDVLNKILD